jgi:hypothetical protein
MKEKSHKCKRCGYAIQLLKHGEWLICLEYINLEKYAREKDVLLATCDGRPHEPEEKSNNFKLIYDILNEDNI